MESEIPIDLHARSLPPPLRPQFALTNDELMRFSETNRLFCIERNPPGEIVFTTPGGGVGGGNEVLFSFDLVGGARRDGAGNTFSPSKGFDPPDSSCLSPDASWLAYARWNALSPEQKAGYPPLCPDFLIEVRWRSDNARLEKQGRSSDRKWREVCFAHRSSGENRDDLCSLDFF